MGSLQDLNEIMHLQREQCLGLGEQSTGHAQLKTLPRAEAMPYQASLTGVSS